MWESGPSGLPKGDIKWLRKEGKKGKLSFQDKRGQMKLMKVLKDDEM